MIPDMETKKKRLYDAIWLWCIGKGYEEQENKESFLDATFSKEEKTTGFIFEFNKAVDEILSRIEKAKEKVQYIYIVINDDSKYRNLKKFCRSFAESSAIQMHLVQVW